MTQASYAQNFEDVMLHRSLSDVDCGFYIDVGANDPDHHSVTKRFYDLGWRGINIEPSKLYFEALQSARPGDINLQVVVSDKDGSADFFEIEGTGISTTERDVSEFHGGKGYASVKRRVKALTLATICETHVKGPVHFLKIDVEGGTKSVLEGLDLRRVRPWIIVVEATKPATQIEDADEWEHLILSQSYIFVYADGLNRFYLASEHAERWRRFKYPPNVFDDFMPSALQLAATVRAQDSWGQMAEARIRELSAEKAAVEDQLAEEIEKTRSVEALLEQHRIELASILRTHDTWGQAAEARITLLEGEKAGLEVDLQQQQVHLQQQIEHARASDNLAAERDEMLKAMENSLSWRLTRPLRYLGRGPKAPAT